MEPVDHLFRHESGRMVAVLTGILGSHNLALAEDVVQDAFCKALDVWKLRGVPENPSAWLMATAKNRAVDILRRERTAQTYYVELGNHLQSEWTLAATVETYFTEGAIKDDQLRMMFSCCDPRLSEQAKIAVILHILCGFSVGEIAGAFVCSFSSTEKRITRAKKVLSSSKRLFDVTSTRDVAERLPSVQRAIYLLFSEGYHGASSKTSVHADLCHEAIRLCRLLIESPGCATPSTLALAALMYLDASRLSSRIDSDGRLIPLFEQNRTLWNQDMITEGLQLLELSSNGTEVSEYHIEAAIASVHSCAFEPKDTNWEAIVSLYETLMRIKPSPIVALNRGIAIGQCEGPERGLDEIYSIPDIERLHSYPFFYAAIGELELRLCKPENAAKNFKSAISHARNPLEKRFLTNRLNAC